MQSQQKIGLEERSVAARGFRGLWNRWTRYLMSPVDGASLAAFRVLFGLLMGIEVARYFANGWIARYYIEPTFFFGYVPGIQPWPGWGMHAHFAVLGGLALMIGLGAFYRTAASLFFVGFTYVFLLDKSNYLNHFYLIALMSFLMALVPAHRCASVDRWRGRVAGDEMVPRWGLLILKLQVACAYFFGGIAKLNSDWLHGQPQSLWMHSKAEWPLLGPYLATDGFIWTLTYGGVLIDLFLPFLLFSSRFFPLAAVIAIGFNLTNAYLFSIGVFPFFMMAALALFARPDWPRRFWSRISKRPTPLALPGAAPAGLSRRSKALIAFLHVYVAAQALIPLRHWLYPSHVHWSEEGHRFSWHMMLRSKTGITELYVDDPLSPGRERVPIEQILSPRQRNAMVTRPDMILQFARFVADEHERRTGVRPGVYTHAHAALNGRPYRLLIDPDVNLAEIEPSIRPADWILPFDGSRLSNEASSPEAP